MASATNSPQPPRKLGCHGRSLWDRVLGEYRIDDIGGVEMLMQGCAGLDRAESLAERIAIDGDVVLTRNGPKVHPAVKEELAARAFVVRTLQKLGLNYENVRPIGRPTAGVGWGG
jgi:hypothetical protein